MTPGRLSGSRSIRTENAHRSKASTTGDARCYICGHTAPSPAPSHHIPSNSLPLLLKLTSPDIVYHSMSVPRSKSTPLHSTCRIIVMLIMAIPAKPLDWPILRVNDDSDKPHVGWDVPPSRNVTANHTDNKLKEGWKAN
ncbi:uncharacterized protein BDV17DRAFT_91130 [Aspergillus undulatus]|uniref:uncharacterized protein n=1 Tax=Aspergillus undulatus TaxID=1810928 RepID=UPI003CCCFD4B